MKPTAQHHFEEFVQYLRVPVWRNGELIEWHEDNHRFVAEWRNKHLLLCIMLAKPEGDTSALLHRLYGRATPQRFIGLPVRVYQDQESIIGALAIPEEAVRTKQLMQLQENLRHMFEAEMS